MKYIYLYILLISFAARPIYYIGQVTYYKCNIDYITETFCVNKKKPELKCNGKCHLSKKLAVLSDAKKDNKPASIVNIVESFYPLYFKSYPKVSFYKTVLINSVDTPLFCNKSYTNVFIGKHLRPPIV